MTTKSKRSHKAVCPVCGQYELDEAVYEICPCCGWAGDYNQRLDPDTTGENNITLTEARKRYAKYGTMSRLKILAMGGEL